MWQFLEYGFFVQALVAVALLSVCSAVIGTYIISRRMVAISGGITHACFGGLGLGYYLGISPVLMAAVFAIGSSLGVDALSSRLRLREDSAIAVVWALGMALGVLFVFMTPGYVPFSSAIFSQSPRPTCGPSAPTRLCWPRFSHGSGAPLSPWPLTAISRL